MVTITLSTTLAQFNAANLINNLFTALAQDLNVSPSTFGCASVVDGNGLVGSTSNAAAGTTDVTLYIQQITGQNSPSTLAVALAADIASQRLNHYLTNNNLPSAVCTSNCGSSSSDGLSSGAIAGIVIGSVVGAAIICCIIVFVLCGGCSSAQKKTTTEEHVDKQPSRQLEEVEMEHPSFSEEETAV